MSLLIEIESDLYSAFVLARDPDGEWIAEMYRELAAEKMEMYAREYLPLSSPMASVRSH